jgi:hypothetical protein
MNVQNFPLQQDMEVNPTGVLQSFMSGDFPLTTQ